ncbi:hypothetical protein EDD63_12813 [Breznakia blatticola]|uniref:Uncharacterized protein n=1 Tax=Breznakia blatticola TaxID=1754012 RepID=A0A4R7ZG40_9FIRM|nr:hypothetical protein [Breznakia blatticola]TDW16115.1 hypothetical protein EDD63_12813 [Breznakia blatticola]
MERKTPFKKEISGIENEKEFVRAFHKKKVKHLPILLYDLVETLYDDIHADDIVCAYHIKEKMKPDFYIEIRGIKKYISVKMGFKTSVHTENVYEFIRFLRSIGVSYSATEAYLHYHFADGTTNGKGDVRLSGEEYKTLYQHEIDEINRAFSRISNIDKILDRFMFVGTQFSCKVDALILGIVEDHWWITTKEIKEQVLRQMNRKTTCPRIGPFSIQPLNRCLNKNPKYEKARYHVQLKWYQISDDILRAMVIRDLETPRDEKKLLEESLPKC